MNTQIEALMWGLVSAVSLPLGAVFGLWLNPKQKINSSLMAFGAGALLFALSIEIFGHVPHHAEKHGISAFVYTALGAITGGIIFDLLNQLLNKKGGFLRKLSSAKKYVAKLKIKRNAELIDELSSIRILTNILPEHMAELIHHVRKVKYKKGEMIFKQGDDAYDMYFVIDGKVKITYHDKLGNDRSLTVMGKYETFGELGILNNSPRTADAKAITDVRLFKIQKFDLNKILTHSPQLQKDLASLADEHINELTLKTNHSYKKKWKLDAMEYLEDVTQAISPAEIKEEGLASAKTITGAALAIWLGIFIDAIPESLVIGMLATSTKGMSLAFIAGVFLANLPEAMSSTVSMRKNNLSIIKILLMWSSICLFTGLGAFVGATYFPANPTGDMFFIILFIEGLAAGAMLTMIAETMLPEAFEHGGAIVGISTLAGFLTALYVKVM